jgi:NAD(P)-dependent dehydrogenase (short-subunit alcohol dehydrogenase family)
VTNKFLPLIQDGGRIVTLSSVASHLDKFDSTLADRYRAASSLDQVDALIAEFEKASKEGKAKSSGWPDPYSVSKASINAMTRILAKANPGVKINCCCPGARQLGKWLRDGETADVFRLVQLRYGRLTRPAPEDAWWVKGLFP